MNNINRVTVYLGSSGRCRPIFKDTAKALGSLIGGTKRSLVYGGMDAGLMGIVANSALANGAKVTGIVPKNLKDSERIHPNLSETILVPDLWERKLKMFKRADAVIVLPGGFGTLDEMAEVFYWANLNLHNKPLAVINIDGYWDKMISYLKSLPDFNPEYLIVADSVDNIFIELENWSAPVGAKKVNGMEKFPHFEHEILSSDEPMIFENATIKDTYIMATALGLKQLDKHQREIGLLNDKGQFSKLLEWIDIAEKEHFITSRCKMLMSVATNMEELKDKLAKQPEIHIDLQTEKWGPSETKTHIEIKETK